MTLPLQPAVTGLVPYLHVGDIHRSIRFYDALGLVPANRVERNGQLIWVMLERGAARLMLATASEPIDAHTQGALLYLYTDDLAALRERLIDAGITTGEISHPTHMSGGELRVDDPDGYCLLIGQLSAAGG